MKSIVEYLNEALKDNVSEAVSFGRQMFDELISKIQKMKLRANFVGDNLAVISDDKPDLDGFVTNVSSNLFPESTTYKKNEDNTKYFGMFNTETKCTTVWVGPDSVIEKMYNDLKKDNSIKLTELF